MNQQAAMRTRSTKKGGTPAKTESKPSSEPEATDQSAAGSVASKAEPEINLEVQIETTKGEEKEKEEGVEEDGEEEEEEGEEEEEEEEEEGDGEGDEDEEEAEEEEEEQEGKLEAHESKEKPSNRHLEVFIGGLSKHTKEDDIKKALEKVGDVVEVRLVMDAKKKKNKGFAFACFATAEHASRAATEFRRIEIDGKSCEILPNEHVLFLGNLNKSWKREQVQEKLKEYSVEGIEELILMENRDNEDENRGFALLEFSNYETARKALLRLAKEDALFGKDKSARVHWGYRNELNDAVMSQVKSVFVDGFPASWTKEKIQEHFSKYGEIEEVVLTHKKKSRYATIDFATRESAVECVSKLEDAEIVDKEDKFKLRVKLNAKLARPRDKKRPLGGYSAGKSAAPPVKKSKVSAAQPKKTSAPKDSRKGGATDKQTRQIVQGSSNRNTASRKREAAAGYSRRSRLAALQRGGNYYTQDVKFNHGQPLGYRNRYNDLEIEFPRPFENIPSRVLHDSFAPIRRSSYVLPDNQDAGYRRDVLSELDQDYRVGELARGVKRPYSYLEGEIGLRRGYIDDERVAAGRYSQLVEVERAPPLRSALRTYDLPGPVSAASVGSRVLPTIYGSTDYVTEPLSGGYLGAGRGYYY